MRMVEQGRKVVKARILIPLDNNLDNLAMFIFYIGIEYHCNQYKKSSTLFKLSIIFMLLSKGDHSSAKID